MSEQLREHIDRRIAVVRIAIDSLHVELGWLKRADVLLTEADSCVVDLVAADNLSPADKLDLGATSDKRQANGWSEVDAIQARQACQAAQHVDVRGFSAREAPATAQQEQIATLKLNLEADFQSAHKVYRDRYNDITKRYTRACKECVENKGRGRDSKEALGEICDIFGQDNIDNDCSYAAKKADISAKYEKELKALMTINEKVQA